MCCSWSLTMYLLLCIARLSPARVLNGIFWAVSEAVATARMDPTVSAEDGPANQEHMGSEDFDASQHAAKLLCESLEESKVRLFVSSCLVYSADTLFATRAATQESCQGCKRQNPHQASSVGCYEQSPRCRSCKIQPSTPRQGFVADLCPWHCRTQDTPVGRQLSRAEWDAVVFAGGALTLLLPQDHSGELGHASRTLPAPATGLTRRQLLDEIAAFYQVAI